MRKETLIALVIATALAAVVLGVASARAQGVPDGCKIGFVNLARVLDESQEGKKMKEQLDAKLKSLSAPLDAKTKQLDELGKQNNALNEEMVKLQSNQDPNLFLSKKNELENLQLQYNQLLSSIQLERDKVQKEFQAEKNQLVQPLTDKLNKIVDDLGKAGGYCLILDISPRAGNLPTFNPIIYRDPAREITDQVIKAVDGK
jgi:outer membrane protein